MFKKFKQYEQKINVAPLGYEEDYRVYEIFESCGLN